jgi:hypothetical protein
MLKRNSSSLFPYKGGQLSCKEKYNQEVPNVRLQAWQERRKESQKIVCKTAILGVLLKGATLVAPAFKKEE